MPELQVFFDDHVSNDFNTLFASLLLDSCRYFTAGMPGSFHGRLFPKGTMNIFHSSFALHWLSKAPEELLDRESDAWNGGRIFYADATQAVMEAYLAQFTKDVDFFLSARAVGMADEGLMVLLFPCRPQGIRPDESALEVVFSYLGSCLSDMANGAREAGYNKKKMYLLGYSRPSEDGYFQLACLFSICAGSEEWFALEVKNVVDQNGPFSIKRLGVPPCPSTVGKVGHPQMASAHFGAASGGIISKHFGDHIMDDLFGRYPAKLEELFNDEEFVASYQQLENLFLLLNCAG